MLVPVTTQLPTVKAKTVKELSLRTLQLTGKNQLEAKQKHSKKRTAAESESAWAYEREQAFLLLIPAS